MYSDLHIPPSWEPLYHFKATPVTYMDDYSSLSLVYVHPIYLQQDSHLLFHYQSSKSHQPVTYQGLASGLLGLCILFPCPIDDLMHHLNDPKPVHGVSHIVLEKLLKMLWIKFPGIDTDVHHHKPILTGVES